MPTLYSRRKRQRERAEAEARGESFWTPSSSERVRTKILYAGQEAGSANWSYVTEQTRYLILKDEGASYLSNGNFNPMTDFLEYLSMGPDEAMPGVIEAIYLALLTYGHSMGFGSQNNPMRYDDFKVEIQEILDEERVYFDFSNGEMIPFESKELFQGVIEPAIKLLHEPRFKAAEIAYRDALEEVGEGKAGDAITDASTALQEMFVAMGCGGNSLGPLIKSARSKGLLAAHDERLTKAITDVVDWVAADRSATGDTHKADKAAKADAWFMVHVVGALIVRLASGERH